MHDGLMELYSLITNGAATAGTGHPAQSPELGAKGWDEVGGVVWVRGCDKLIRLSRRLGRVVGTRHID
jgi:hypothetical protein